MNTRCEICNINQAQAKDYRNVNGIYNKYIVCQNCFALDDEWFFRLKKAKEGIGKKRIVSKIIEDSWKGYMIIEKNQ